PVLEEGGAGKQKIEAIGAVAHRGIPTRGGDGVRVDVDAQHPQGAQLEAGDGEDARARADVQDQVGRRLADGRVQQGQASFGAAVMPGAEGAPRLDDDGDPPGTLGALPGRTHPEPAPDRAGGKRLLPGAGPRFFDEGRDLDLARRRREAEGPELGRIGGHARHQSRRGGAVGEERADARRLRRSLFLDDAERALLPEEIREAFGGVGRGGDGQLPEAHGGGTATSDGASTAEELLHTLEEGGKQRARGLLRGLPKLLEKLTLARAQSRRHLDHDLVDGIAAAATAQVGHALALDEEALPRLGASGHVEARLAVEDGHVDLVAQADLGIRQGQLADEISALSHEDLVRADLEEYVEIARMPAGQAALAFAGEAELIAVLDAGRDGDLEELLARHPPRACAAPARVAVDASRPRAGGTGSRHGEEPLREADLPLPTAGAADLGR